MFKVMTSSSGVTAFRAVMKKEMDVKKDMSGEEAMITRRQKLTYLTGIWTKHLKAKTELHQTVIDRCLKSLVQKQLVKSIKAVRHPTRKIYMLAHLEPSVELTGGPWYTDNELDTEFIKLLSTACLHYIRDRSFPKQSGKRSSHSQHRLYAIGAAPAYPSAQQIQHFLSKSKITETELGVEHVEMLLRVLELDGEIEKIPAFAAFAWEFKAASDADSGDSDEERSSSKKRKRGSSKNKSKESSKRKRRAEDSEGSDSDEERSKKKTKKRSRKSDDSDEGADKPKLKKKRKHKSKKDDSSDSNAEEEESEEESHTKKKRKGKLKKCDNSLSESSDEAGSEDETGRPRSKLKPKSSTKKASTSKASVKHQKSPSPVLNEILAGGAFVYRAIRQEGVALGWSQAPCGRCPVFDFCRDKGPTNPRECVYYEEWYTLGTGAQKTAAPAAVKMEF
ncbi:RNA polymerase Rpc34 subunit-domain-containing protein [Lanmaoa asiatica]|nr:RNA polymerase Rpc34 subunit-domain-containing protein [Lanmaoa asiatica]